MSFIVGNGLIFSEGESWKRKRKIMSKVFNFELLTKNTDKICSVFDKYYDLFDKKYIGQDNTIRFSPQELGSYMFHSTILRCFFGCD